MYVLDGETHLIQPGCTAPKLVCISFIDGTRQDRGLVDRLQGVVLARQWLEAGEVLAGHNIAYDLGVLCAEDPSLLPLVFKAYDEGRIRCTKIRQQLLDIATGDSKFYTEEDDEGSWKAYRTEYSLEALCRRVLGRVIKKAGTWRLRYAELDGVPIADWPQEARDYAMGDAIHTADLHDAQTAAAQGVYGSGEIADSDRQHAEAWALHLMSMWGLRTDRVAVTDLHRKLDADINEAHAALKGTEIFRISGSKNMAEIKARVERGYVAQGMEVPRTLKGQIKYGADVLLASKDPELKLLAKSLKSEKARSVWMYPLYEGIDRPINVNYNVLVDSGRVSASHPPIQQPPRAGNVRPCFAARPGYVYAFCDYDTAEIRSLAQVCLDLFGHSAMADTLRSGTDFHLNLASQVMGISLAEAVERYERGDKAVEDQRQLAKCVAGDTLISTATGLKPIRDLVEHRKLGFSMLRKPFPLVSWDGVRSATQGYYGGEQETYRLVAVNGLEVTATADHKMLTFRDGRFAWVELQDLKNGEKLFFKLGADVHGRSERVPQVEVEARTSFKPLDIPESLSLELARFLGFYVSEGSTSADGTRYVTSVAFTDEAPDVVKLFDRDIKKLFGERVRVSHRRVSGWHDLTTWRISSKTMHAWLSEIGAGCKSHDKAIPSIVLNGPRWFKTEFLRALFEGDGSVSAGQGSHANSVIRTVRYCSKSKQLVHQIQLELLNLGIPSRVCSERRNGYPDPYWNLTITGSRHMRRFETEIGFVSKLRHGALKRANKSRMKDHPVLYLPGDNLLALRETLVGYQIREDVKRPAERGGDLSELLVDKLTGQLDGDEAFAVKHGLWCTRVASIRSAGKQEVFDLYEPEAEVALFNGLIGRDCAAFGMPGGMSSDTFVEYAAGYGLDVAPSRAAEVKAAWLDTFPEMRDFFDWIGNITTGGFGDIVQVRSNRKRGRIRFTAACNTMFQGLTADGAKDALYRVTREAYLDTTSPLYGARPVLFMHDEIGAEIPYDPSHPELASAAAKCMAKVMIDAMQSWLPDVPVTAKPVMCRRWHKGAKPVYDDAGNLIPCKPQKTPDGRTIWVADL